MLIARRTPGPRRPLSGFGGVITTTVLQLQCGLWQLGFDPGRFDGLWGPVTRGAWNRWWNWWLSRNPDVELFEADGATVRDYWAIDGAVPNRPSTLTMPEEYGELLEAAGRGPCQLERRGTHRQPPVPEPQPLRPPPVVVDPDRPDEPARPVTAPVIVESALSPGMVFLGVLAVGTIAYLVVTKLREPKDDFRMVSMGSTVGRTMLPRMR